MIKKSLNIPKG